MQSTFETSGRMAAIRYEEDATEIRTNLVLASPGWQRIYSLPTAQGLTVSREPAATAWKGSLAIDDPHRIDFTQTVSESATTTILALEYTAVGDLAVEGLYLRIDLPWEDFAGGSMETDSGRTLALPSASPAKPNLLAAKTSSLLAIAPGGTLRSWARFDRRVSINLQNKSDESPRAFTAWVSLLNGRTIRSGTEGKLVVEFAVSGVPDIRPATLTLDLAPRYRFYGFGGNYCFEVDSPVARYTLDNLAVRYGRVEMSLDDWAADDRPFDERDAPGTRLRAQFETAQRLQQRGIPYVISVWRLPERMYADAGKRPPSLGRRKVDRASWNAVLEAIGSYLLWARNHWGTEPELFSFNEPDIGVNVWFTPEEHRDAVRSIGAYLEGRGLRTRVLLGDVHSPRGTIDYVKPAVKDPEAMRYAGALSFHSWGGATPHEYSAWADLAASLGIPLLVAEMGTDPSAWQGREFASFWYGLNEVRMYQELLLYARPQSTLYWEFTTDYSLLGPDLEPTTRFWFTKQFTDLTPAAADALTTRSDHAKVLFTAFRKDAQYTLHVANFGAARQARIEIAAAEVAWRRGVRTSQSESYVEFVPDPPSGGMLLLDLPERSLVTLVGDGRR